MLKADSSTLFYGAQQMEGCSRILVTGGAGFIGSHIVDRLMDENLEVTVFDNLSAGELDNIKLYTKRKNLDIVRGDIRDFDLVKTAVKNVDAVFHEAAIVSVPKSVEDPLVVNDVNVNGTLNLLKACADTGVKRFIYASSSAVYGKPQKIPISEDCFTRPLSPYGVSKLAAESYAYAFWKIFGLETVCLRYFNVYGPRQACNYYGGVITKFMDCVANNHNLVVFDDGKQTRDFVYVKDVVEANILALRATGIAGETFNIGTGTATTINQLAEVLLEITDKHDLKVRHVKPNKGDIRHSIADISKAKMKLHYRPKSSLEEGLRDMIGR